MRLTTLLGLIALTFGTASAGSIVFQDNFSSGAQAPPETALSNDTTLGALFTGANFSLTAGSIDINNGSSYGWLCQSTAPYCIDTTGTVNSLGQPNPGQIESIAITFPTAGSYNLSFDLFGWNDTQNSGGPQTGQVNVALGSAAMLGSLSSLAGSGCPSCVVNQTYNTDGSVPFGGATQVNFNVIDPTTSYFLVFTDTGNNHSAQFAGSILDNISIQATPEPASMLLVGGALAGLAFWRGRRGSHIRGGEAN